MSVNLNVELCIKGTINCVKVQFEMYQAIVLKCTVTLRTVISVHFVPYQNVLILWYPPYLNDFQCTENTLNTLWYSAKYAARISGCS